MVKKETLKRFADPRGFIFEPLDGRLLHSQKNVHVVVSRPGAVRGNHYHLRGTETLVICGPSLVRIRIDEKVQDIAIPAGSTWRLMIPPGIAHAIQNVGESDNLLVAFNTEPHDPKNPDTVQDVLIPV
jgi:dTDP-4-dehydrorhamnose 3,5-epimerase-like enzyme